MFGCAPMVHYDAGYVIGHHECVVVIGYHECICVCLKKTQEFGAVADDGAIGEATADLVSVTRYASEQGVLVGAATHMHYRAHPQPVHDRCI